MVISNAVVQTQSLVPLDSPRNL